MNREKYVTYDALTLAQAVGLDYFDQVDLTQAELAAWLREEFYKHVYVNFDGPEDWFFVVRDLRYNQVNPIIRTGFPTYEVAMEAGLYAALDFIMSLIETIEKETASLSNLPGTCNEPFKLTMKSSLFKKDDELLTGDNVKALVLSTPKKRNKWYHKLIKFVSFGLLCQPTWYYKIKLKDKDEQEV